MDDSEDENVLSQPTQPTDDDNTIENVGSNNQANKVDENGIEQQKIDWNNISYETAVGKRMDCDSMIYTKVEKQLYGKNRTLKNGEIAYLCRLYAKHKCKSRLYFKNGRLYRKGDFIEHNHPIQEQEKINFDIECIIKKECSNIDVLVNAKTQSSECHEVFQRNMKK